MQKKLLREVIESHVHLGRESAKGFRSLRCAVCNDYKDRAAFKFDGEDVGFNCFNCGAKFLYKDNALSKSAKSILVQFGIPAQELDAVVGTNFFVKSNEPKEITLEVMTKPTVSLYTPALDLPPNTHPLGSRFSEELQEPLIEYLFKRCLDPLELNAQFSTDPKYLNRVIIPCMREGKVIYWQARTILDGGQPRYLSPGTSKEAVLWGYDNLWKNYDAPLFITEGIFDAAIVAGAALIGSKMNEAKLQVLQKSRRRKVVVMDKDKNGAALADLALQTGWEVSFPGERQNAIDINQCAQKYGRLYTIRTLMKNITNPQGIRGADGVVVQSKLNIGIEQALARMSRRTT